MAKLLEMEGRAYARRVEPEGRNAQRQDSTQGVWAYSGRNETAIDAGHLQYRIGVIHGNPWLRLLRREVEELMTTTYNDRDHRKRRTRAELARVDRELKKLRAEAAVLEEHREKLLADLQA
jgi:hypothetical protein